MRWRGALHLCTDTSGSFDSGTYWGEALASIKVAEGVGGMRCSTFHKVTTKHFVTMGVCRHTRAGIDVVCGSLVHGKVVLGDNKELLGSSSLQSDMFRPWGSKDPPDAQSTPDVTGYEESLAEYTNRAS